MTNLKRGLLQGIAATLVFCGTAVADDARVLTWEELLPEGEAAEQPAEPAQPSEQLYDDSDSAQGSYGHMFVPPPLPGGVVEELDGVLIKLPGFIVPLELDGEGKVSEFLLVPYFGACIHYPPPPPNQMVYISTDDPIEMEMTWEPIWVTGNLETDRVRSEFGSVDYSMAADLIEVYEY